MSSKTCVDFIPTQYAKNNELLLYIYWMQVLTGIPQAADHVTECVASGAWQKMSCTLFPWTWGKWWLVPSGLQTKALLIVPSGD